MLQGRFSGGRCEEIVGGWVDRKLYRTWIMARLLSGGELLGKGRVSVTEVKVIRTLTRCSVCPRVDRPQRIKGSQEVKSRQRLNSEKVL